MRDREIRLAGPQPEKTTDVPATREARIEGEGGIALAVSQTSDPLGMYFIYIFG